MLRRVFCGLLLMVLAMPVVGQLSPSANNTQLFVRAWRHSYPEPAHLNTSRTTNSAIVFSGGGSRAFAVTLGYLRGLLDIGVLPRIRYMSGVSGGSWATCAFSFFQNPDPQQTGAEEAFLGDIVGPANITYAKLAEIPAMCGRRLATADFASYVLRILKQTDYDLHRIWTQAVSDIYFAPLGVAQNMSFALSPDSVETIVKSNPLLSASQFYTLRPERPFPIFGVTLIGPYADYPFEVRNRSFTFLEFSPLYVGEGFVRNVTYNSDSGHKSVHQVGGFIETFAFNTSAPAAGMQPNQEAATLRVTASSSTPWSLVDTAAISSFAPGAVLSEFPLLSRVAGVRSNYWSPAAARPQTTDMLVGDGGLSENAHLFGMLRRRVEHVLLFFSTSVPLQPASRYDPTKRRPTPGDLDDDIPAYFGMLDEPFNVEYDYSRNAVFAQKYYVPFVQQLQKTQAAGGLIYANMLLTTIDNQWWGIQAGTAVNLTVVYLGRLWQWEQALNKEMQSYVLPLTNKDDYGHTRELGEFSGFPNVATSLAGLDARHVNLLADFTGWQVTHNAAVFRRALGIPS